MLLRARSEVEELRHRWTAVSAELQEVTTLLGAAIERIAYLSAETKSGDVRRERRGELNRTARAVRVPTSPWLTPSEAADRARFHRETIYDALHQEELKPGTGLRGRQHKAPNGSWLIHIDDLDAWACGEPTPKRHLHIASGESVLITSSSDTWWIGASLLFTIVTLTPPKESSSKKTRRACAASRSRRSAARRSASSAYRRLSRTAGVRATTTAPKVPTAPSHAGTDPQSTMRQP
ncbi:helix-turn-helix domain-containing protein [Rhodococcus sp. Leaf278]|uniref:helix-turn-helix domain-containing protein n=1 Tax=Rhodococcus sp. Leaf278 TaxID=1736319 RepID=UPI000AFCA1D3